MRASLNGLTISHLCLSALPRATKEVPTTAQTPLRRVADRQIQLIAGHAPPRAAAPPAARRHATPARARAHARAPEKDTELSAFRWQIPCSPVENATCGMSSANELGATANARPR